jgi:hypothetical protein
MLLPRNQITALHAAAVSAGLADQRPALLASVHKFFVAQIRRAGNDIGQVLLDLHHMNEAEELTDGSVPLLEWLTSAAALTTGSAHEATFRAALEDVGRRSGRSPPPVAPVSGPVKWKAGVRAGGVEALTGARSTWVDVAFLERGQKCARAVVRVDAHFEDQSLTGTAFHIAPGRLLTNHHVLYHEGVPASRVELWIDYAIEEDESIRPPRRVVISKPVIDGAEQHDWATLDVDDPGLRSAPCLTLGGTREVRVGDFATLIHHPHGLPKKLGIFRNEVRYVDGDVVQYLTDTAVGSSGSPVLNERWEVVALHHAWSNVPTAETAEIRNEGVRIERVVEALKSRALLPGR